jgi:hypothetical protein
MDQILKALQDPLWWFNTFFVAILVALLGGWLKDATSRWLSRSSAWYRQRKVAALSRQEQELELLVAEPALLTLRIIHAVVALLMFFFCFGSFLFMPVWSELMHSSPAFSSWFLYRPLPGTDPNAWISMTKDLIILLGGMSFFMAYVAMSRLSACQRAYQRLYNNRKKARSERTPDSKPTDPDPLRLNP